MGCLIEPHNFRMLAVRTLVNAHATAQGKDCVATMAMLFRVRVDGTWRDVSCAGCMPLRVCASWSSSPASRVQKSGAGGGGFGEETRLTEEEEEEGIMGGKAV